MNPQTALRQLHDLEQFANTTNMRLAAEGWDADWKILVAILMSAQARDEVTIQIAEKLFKKYPTPKQIAQANILDIQQQIKSLNYFKTKGKHIHELCIYLQNNQLPYTMEELIKLPGVGRKTANVFLVETKTDQGIAVDTHVYRISRYLGWATANTRDGVEQDLMKIFPKKDWHRINDALVRFAKEYGRSKTQEIEILEAIKAGVPVKEVIKRYAKK